MTKANVFEFKKLTGHHMQNDIVLGTSFRTSSCVVVLSANFLWVYKTKHSVTYNSKEIQEYTTEYNIN